VDYDLMPVDERAENEAKEELLQIKEERKKRVDVIRETQVSRSEAKGYRLLIWDVKNRFRDRYGPYVSIELFHESMSAIEIISTDVSIALRKGQENYRLGRDKRWREWITALGGGIIIWAIIFLVCKIVFNIEFPFCR
jgi:hypothetical protein